MIGRRQRSALLPRRSALLVVGALAGAPLSDALAQPPPVEARAHEAVWVIAPGREPEARALFGPVLAATPPGTRWRGPQIEVDRIKWWLMADAGARAMVVLAPRALGSAEAATSESFAIELAWAPGVEPSAAEQALMADMIAAVQANDPGNFHGVAIDNLIGDDVPGERRPYLAKPTAADPRAVWRGWALRLAGVGLLALLSLAVIIRGLWRPATAERPRS